MLLAGYAILGIDFTQFLVKSKSRFVASSLLDTVYVVTISNLQMSSFKLQNACLLACNFHGINDAIKVTLFDVITYHASLAIRRDWKPETSQHDDKVPIILGRPMLATTHARIDVFRGKISLEVGMEQIIFNTNEGTSSSTVSPVCVINDHDIINNFGTEDLDELLKNDDLNGDLGDFLHQNDLLPNLDDP
ncbi:hypothetical protein Tco_0772650 [Tanacetum coccineum]|uniref:Uncharacterized protein n=1 Tax=Tanacetum coccineum TaxID=301880 RepID=A0ABQ4ZIH8_9ASTR